MRVFVPSMKYIIKYNIDEHPSNRSDEHDSRLLHKLFIDDSLSGSIDDEDNHKPNDKDIGERTDQLHTMITK